MRTHLKTALFVHTVYLCVRVIIQINSFYLAINHSPIGKLLTKSLYIIFINIGLQIINGILRCMCLLILHFLFFSVATRNVRARGGAVG
jgi:hypothetical protein